MKISRRTFVLTGAAASAATAWPRSAALAGARTAADPMVILFQGDSITDAGRDRASKAGNDAHALGSGYPLLIASQLEAQQVDRDLQAFNRGVSGNTVTDLRTRWQDDTISLRPQLLSILIGVNDIWHTLTGGYNGTVEKYESGNSALLAGTREALPATKIVVLEPFVLRTGAVTDAWFPDFDRYRAAAQRVARAAGATFIPLHEMFQALAGKTTPAHWASDGVHPTLAGHGAIARQWLEIVRL